jgi:hypothetical protein
VEGLYYRTEEENIWKKIEGPISKRSIFCLELDPEKPLVYAGTDKGIYRASLDTLAFARPSDSDLNSRVWSLAGSKSIPDLIYAGTGLGLLSSKDQGVTWSVISSEGLPAGASIEALAISPGNKEHLMAGTSVGLFESQNGGVHWERVSNDGLDGQVASVLFLDDSGSRVLAADRLSSAIYYSRDGGQTWDRITSPQFESAIFCLARDPVKPSRVFIGTQSDGIFLLDFP